MSTVRFSNVVQQSGKPEPYTLWSDPKKDPDFQKALKANRVMTVHQDAVGTKTDFGTVGYSGDTSATFLLFPKSLAAFEGKRVVGIKYDLLEAQPQTRGAKVKLPKESAERPKPKPTRKPELANIIPFIAREEEPEPDDTAPKRHERKANEPKEKPKAEKDGAEAKPERTKLRKARIEQPKIGKRKAESPKREDVSAKSRAAAPSPAELRREILKAMKALKAGKAVVAYETLQGLETKLSAFDQH